ncbi:hypothetical protein [Lignipirellula cremea]|uniref:Uncharacterized protein n=1 Tax=Lignipirellula cremea TaxID=2528010 RepID=A0A518DXA5_9BACT|nr:hypothetical protein [Lignipirellula cremea]QDU96462.1 hypothetical protein Pla8534_42830 [Lignipirellula cremea]
MDPSQHAQDRNFLEKMAAYIPGFHGYMQREYRRESDQMLRTFMADRLQRSKTGIDGYMQTLIGRGQLDGLDQVERIRTKLDTLIAGLRGAMRGYSAAFEYVKVHESTLEQVYEHDLRLVRDVEDLATRIEELPASDAPPAGVAAEFTRAVDEVQQLFDERGRLLEGMGEK